MFVLFLKCVTDFQVFSDSPGGTNVTADRICFETTEFHFEVFISVVVFVKYVHSAG